MIPLPPVTEERVRTAFADRGTIDAKVAAELLGVDVSSLREMTRLGT
jgi:hypothetical protein